MNNDRSDEIFAEAYTVFSERHDAQRGRLMSQLDQTRPAPRRDSGRWGRLVIAIAASAAIVAFALPALVGRPSYAYTLQDLPTRLAEIRSIYVAGKTYHNVRTDAGIQRQSFSTVMYAERPNRFRHTFYGFSSDSAGAVDRVTSGYRVTDGKQQVAVLHDRRTAIHTSLDPLVAELMTERFVRSHIHHTLLAGRSSEYKSRGMARIDGVDGRLYEMKKGTSLHRVLFNPETGIPLRILIYRIGDDDKRILEQSYDRIEVNVLHPELRTAIGPDDYAVQQVRQPGTAGQPGLSSASSGQGSIACGFALSIDDRAVLLPTWFEVRKQEDDDKPQESDGATYTLRGLDADRECRAETVGTFPAAGRDWRWTLLTPVDGRPLGDATVNMKMELSRSQFHLEETAIPFSEQRMAEVVTRIQELADPAGSASRFTYEELKQRLATR